MEEFKKLIDLICECNKVCEAIDNDENNRIEFCGCVADRLHIYRGIEQIASALGCELTSRTIESSDCSYYMEKSFEYNGIKIFQLFKPEEK